MTEMHLSVSLTSNCDFDTDYVTQKLGVTPCQIRKKGEKIGPVGSTSVYKYTEWEYATEQIFAEDAQLLITQMMQMFQCRAETMLDLANWCTGQWSIVLDGYIHSGNAPTVLLLPEAVKFCSLIKAIFQCVIDISYDYTNREEEQMGYGSAEN